MNAVLHLVDEQKAVATVGESQGNAEQPHRAVAKTLERNRPRPVLQLHEHALAIHSKAPLLVSSDRYPFHAAAKNQLQGFQHPIFLVRQHDVIPESCDLVVVRQSRPEGCELYLAGKIAIVMKPSKTPELVRQLDGRQHSDCSSKHDPQHHDVLIFERFRERRGNTIEMPIAR